MHLSDKSEFTDLLINVGALCQHAINETVAELYWSVLEKYELAEVRQAIYSYLEHKKTMPLPADVCQYLMRDAKAAAIKAWHRVAHAIDEIGSYKSVVFDDALIHAVIEDMGGWQAMGKLLNRDLPEHAKEFVQHYIRYLEQPPKTYPRILKGHIDLHNEASGFKNRAHVAFVGDKQKAQGVMKKGGDASNTGYFHVVKREVIGLQKSLKPSSPLCASCRLSSTADNNDRVFDDSLSEKSKEAQVG